MVSFLVKANGYETIEPLLADIKADKLTVYSASKRLVDSMIRTHSPATVYGYRSMLPGLFQSVLGEENFRTTVFDRLPRKPQEHSNPGRVTSNVDNG